MKILHLPTSVGGNSWGLAEGERLLGLDSIVLVESQNWLNYPCDICLNLNRYSKFGKVFKKVKTFFEVNNRYDVYHFNFGSSLVDMQKFGINLWDLPYYNGKKVMTYNGCDARQKYETIKRVEFSACHNKNCYNGICNNGKLDMQRAKRIKKVEKYIDHIFALNPDLMHVLPSSKTTFLPYTIAGWNSIKKVEYKVDNMIRIVHSPTNREAKGSDFILNALTSLKKKYNFLEIDMIEKVPYYEALKKYQEAHIVIDQVLIGWYGAFGVEVMKMGKPLAVFIREEDLKFIPEEMAEDLKKAIININPFNIEKVLEQYILDKELLYKKSKLGFDYVNKWHNPKYVASITKSVYEGL